MIVKTHDVFCDRCPDWAYTASCTDGQGGAREARRLARIAGWKRVNGQDVCPTCIDASSELSAAEQTQNKPTDLETACK